MPNKFTYMKKYSLFVLLYLFSVTITFSQNISGVLVNENTAKPIPYTEVLSQKFGFMTGENGQFILDKFSVLFQSIFIGNNY